MNLILAILLLSTIGCSHTGSINNNLLSLVESRNDNKSINTALAKTVSQPAIVLPVTTKTFNWKLPIDASNYIYVVQYRTNVNGQWYNEWFNPPSEYWTTYDKITPFKEWRLLGIHK